MDVSEEDNQEIEDEDEPTHSTRREANKVEISLIMSLCDTMSTLYIYNDHTVQYLFGLVINS